MSYILDLILDFILYCIWEVIFGTICFWVGAVFLTIVTLGRYPRFPVDESDKGKVEFAGFLFLMSSVLIMMLLDYKNG